MISVQVRLRTVTALVDEMAGCETVEAIGGGEGMRLVISDEVGEAPAGRRRRLEAAITPAAVQVEPVDRCPVDDGGAVHRHVHDAAPMAQHANAAEAGPERHSTFHDVLDERQFAALCIGIVAVEITTEDET